MPQKKEKKIKKNLSTSLKKLGRIQMREKKCQVS